MRATLLLLATLMFTAACSNQGEVLNETGMIVVSLPDGFQIKAEVVSNPKDMMRGMMFRDALPPGRGMLFLHRKPDSYPYWMYQVRIPLDLIWMDAERRVVELVPSAPPCENPKSANDCPNYGGTVKSSFVLELAGGEAAKHNVRVGSVLSF